VILTADHGGSGRDHGGSSRANSTIPWVIAGPGIAPQAIGCRISTMDTAATALRVLGLGLPAGAAGVVVSGVFVPTASSAQLADAELGSLGKDVPLASGDDTAKSRHRGLKGGVVVGLAGIR
jgi:hypothetical protein